MNKESGALVVADKNRVRGKPNLALWQAITISAVAILAVAIGTAYGTILS